MLRDLPFCVAEYGAGFVTCRPRVLPGNCRQRGLVANGKSCIQQLAQVHYGKYYTEVPVTVF